MDAPGWNGDDTREFGPKHDICRECGECVCEYCDGHDARCSHHPDYYEDPRSYEREDDDAA